MAGKRFKTLNAALKKWLKTTVDAAPTIPPNTPIEFFSKVQSGETVVKYDANTWPKKVSVKKLYVAPFYMGDLDIQHSHPGSERATGLSANTAFVTACDLNLVGDKAKFAPPGFIAARATASLLSGTATEKPSKYTGVKYNSKSNDSYTLPFGLKTATDKLGERIAAINTAAIAIAGWQCAFKPENPGKIS